MMTVGNLIEQLRKYPAQAVLAIDVTPTDENQFLVHLTEDIATYLDEDGTVRSGPMVILTVG